MKKTLKINLDYDIPQNERKRPDGSIVTYSEFTKNLISMAFQSNHPQMDSDTARLYREIIMTLRAHLMNNDDYVMFSKSEFDRIYKEVYDAKIPASHALYMPILYDELDRVKNRSEKEDQELADNVINMEGVRSAETS